MYSVLTEWVYSLLYVFLSPPPPSPLPPSPPLPPSLSLSVSFSVAFSSHLKRKVKGDDEGMGDSLKDALLLEHLVDVTATENVVLRVRVYMWIEDRRAEV